MSQHTVVNVIDGDTFDVNPEWIRNGEKGGRVRIANMDAPEEGQSGYQAAKDRLTDLILNKQVTLGPALNFDRGRLVCEVYHQGKSLVSLLS